jgi:hypothetical protein
MTFEIKRGDTAPTFDKRLREENGEPVNLTDFQEVDFHMRDDNYNTIVTADTSNSVSVTLSSSGDVEYAWQSGDTDTLGSYKAEFVVTFSDGTTQSFPRRGMYSIEITEDIDD